MNISRALNTRKRSSIVWIKNRTFLLLLRRFQTRTKLRMKNRMTDLSLTAPCRFIYLWLLCNCSESHLTTADIPRIFFFFCFLLHSTNISLIPFSLNLLPWKKNVEKTRKTWKREVLLFQSEPNVHTLFPLTRIFHQGKNPQKCVCVCGVDMESIRWNKGNKMWGKK